MISVTIFINGQPIATRGARNTMQTESGGKTVYVVDDGGTILHAPKDGAVKLAIELLKRITEL